MRPWLALRKTMEAALEAQRGLYNRLLGERDREIIRLRELDRLNRERRHELSDSCERSEAELARLRAHFDATCKSKDEAYATLAGDRDAWKDAAYSLGQMYDEAGSRLDSYGLGDADWAASSDPFLSSVVVADFNGVRGKVGWLGGDPGGDDPRYSPGKPMGLKA